jgi:hypothetical protein
MLKSGYRRFFTQWKAPDNFKIELFVIRVSDWGGFTLKFVRSML